jgi:2TM domain
MEMTEGELRTHARQRVQARIGLGLHLVTYVLVNTGLVVIWAVTGTHYPWFLWPVFGWGIGLAGHVIAYYFGPGSPGQERAIAREVRRLQARAQ